MTGRPPLCEQQVNSPPGSMNLQVRYRIRTGHSVLATLWFVVCATRVAASPRAGPAQTPDVSAMIAMTKIAM